MADKPECKGRGNGIIFGYYLEFPFQTGVWDELQAVNSIC